MRPFAVVTGFAARLQQEGSIDERHECHEKASLSGKTLLRLLTSTIVLSMI